MVSKVRPHDEHSHDLDSTAEDTPLLKSFPEPLGSASPSHAKHLQSYVLTIMILFIFVVDFAIFLQTAPRTRVIESIICNNFYREHDPSQIGDKGVVDERLCKIDPVQGELAMLAGWGDFFDNLPGLFLAIPFGTLADRYGRKWLLVLNSVSIFLRFIWAIMICAFPQTFPIHLIWLQSVLAIFGGGSLVLIALIYVICADVTTGPQRATVFFGLQAAFLSTQVLGPPLGSFLMNRDPWIAMKLSAGLIALIIPLSLALPETLGVLKSSEELCGSTEDIDLLLNAPLTRTHSSDTQKPGLLIRASSLLSYFIANTRFIFHDWRIIFLMSCFIVFQMDIICGELLLQYVSKRWLWTLAKANYVFALRAGVSMVLLLSVIPAVSIWLVKRRGFSTLRKDFLLSRISYTLTSVGLLMVALAPTIPGLLVGIFVSTLGTGAHSLVRSMLTNMVEPNEVGRLFTAASIVSTVGSLIAAPTITGLFNAGLGWGGVWIGLPYMVCAFCNVVITVGMLGLDLHRKEMVVEEGEGHVDGE